MTLLCDPETFGSPKSDIARHSTIGYAAKSAMAPSSRCSHYSKCFHVGGIGLLYLRSSVVACRDPKREAASARFSASGKETSRLNPEVYELVIVWVEHVSAAGVKGRVRIRIPVLHVTLDVDKRLRHGLELDLELAVARTINLVA